MDAPGGGDESHVAVDHRSRFLAPTSATSPAQSIKVTPLMSRQELVDAQLGQLPRALPHPARVAASSSPVARMRGLPRPPSTSMVMSP